MHGHARIGAVVLAAGQSRRMGSPKALLPIDGQPMLQRVLETLRRANHIWPIVAVTGHEPHCLRPMIHACGAIEAHNEAFETGGMISSVQCGLSEIRDAIDASFIVLVDQPMVRPLTLSTLASAWRARRPTILLPSHNRRHGHPIIISARAIGQILDLPVDATLKTFTARHVSSTLDIEVDDSAILEDIDTPEDYARAVQQQRDDVELKDPSCTNETTQAV